MDQKITVGKVTAPHGVKGEVKVVPLTDFPERFKKKEKVWLDLINDFLEIESIREQEGFFLVKFSGINDRNEAGKIKNGRLQIERDQVKKLPEGQYYKFEIIGLKGYDPAGNLIGQVREILETGANDVYIIAREHQKDLLVPAIKSVIKEIDLANGRMIIEIPPGLDD